MSDRVRRFGEVAAGEELPPAHHTPTRVTMFLFGVAYWTAHRTHYDVEFARAEGFADVLVPAGLLSAYGAELLTTWAGDPGCLRELRERNLSPAVAGERLTVRACVTGLEPAADGGVVSCALSITAGDRPVTEGRARLVLPA
ncbi:hypothetical protein BJF78_14410 [Pseudonocardia sp. CNS-139]|nr:hypothetical protein BJF78_14410 [Pseudonocardia sp. CNS-139]